MPGEARGISVPVTELRRRHPCPRVHQGGVAGQVVVLGVWAVTGDRAVNEVGQALVHHLEAKTEPLVDAWAPRFDENISGLEQT